MKNLVLVAFGAVLFLSPGLVMAEDKKSEKKGTPKNEILVAAEEFTEGFDDASKRHFNVLYGNYNLIKVVETVRDSVSKTVDACGDQNPDMKDKLEGRFDEWKKAVKPVLKEADANVNNMVLAQDYAKPRKIKKFFRRIDKVRKAKDKEVKKIPVTSVEGCENLLKSMDSTQPNMVKLLQATLVSLPQAMQAEDDAAKAKAKAEAEEAAKKAAEEAEKKAAEDAKKEVAEDKKQDADKDEAEE